MTDPESYDRIILEKIFVIARKRLRGLDRMAMTELINRYQGDEQAVTITTRQLAAALGVGNSTAARRINYLVTARFISVIPEDKGDFKQKRKPSRYRLNMFDYRGERAKHEYAFNSEWNQVRRPRPTVPLRVSEETVLDAAETILERRREA